MKKIKNIKNTKLNVNIAEKSSTNHLKPLFSFEYLQGDYCLSNCDDKMKVQFINRLHSLAKSTWQELQQLERHKKGYELLPITAVRIAKPIFFTDELKYMIFHTGDSHPIIGIRLSQTYYILGIDYDRTAYEHG